MSRILALLSALFLRRRSPLAAATFGGASRSPGRLRGSAPSSGGAPLRAARPAGRRSTCRRPARVRSSGTTELRVSPGQRIAHRSRRPTSITSRRRSAGRPTASGCRSTKQTEQSLLEDFKRLWATNFLDNLWIETLDEPFANGVMGKHVIYHMEERPRVKIVDYTGSTKVERTKIDEKMKELGISLRLDSFLDQARRPPRRGHRQEPHGREGLRVRRGHVDGRAAAGGPEAGEGGLRRQGRPEGQGPRPSTSSATARSATARWRGR